METLYIECLSGISGDMTVGALLDLGADREALINGLKSLNVDGFNIKITDIIKNNFKACDYDVIIKDDEDSKTFFEVNRNYFDICDIIESSSISNKAKEISKRIFKVKAEAGATVHDVPIENYYFHESGALDSLADIVGAAICIDNLKIGRVITSKIYDGHGFIKYRKGMLPVPVPAVLHITNEYDLELISTEIEGEMVTPTGAAILAGITTGDKLPDDYRIKRVGIGNGKRSYDSDSLLRMYLIE